MVFQLLVCGILFVLVVLGFVGRVCYGVGGIFPSIRFVLGWLSETDWVLEIGWVDGIDWFLCIAFFVGRVVSFVIICSFHVLFGVKFGLGSFRLCLLLIGLGIGGLNCLGFVIRVLGRVWGKSCGVFSRVLRFTLSGMSVIIIFILWA